MQNEQSLVQDLLLWQDKDAKLLLDTLAKKHGVSLDALALLIDWQRARQEKRRSRNRDVTFNDIFDNDDYWH